MKDSLPINKNRKRLIKVKAKTNENFGKKPSEYTIDDLLKNGIIIIDKPKGPTSHQVDSWIRKILNIEKLGHSGTLDPNATGVLPIGIGNATKVLYCLLSAGKEYVGVMHLHKKIEEKRIVDISKSFTGEITQLPPVRSAVKRVRRKRRIYYLDIIQIKEKDVLFKVGCESGTYVRTLCVDIGKKLKTGANLAELRRTRVGLFSEEDAHILQDLKDALVFYKEDKNPEELKKIVLPVERLFDHLPKLVIRDSAVDAICHGANLAVPGVAEIDSDIKKDDTIAIYTLKGEAVALATALMSTEDIIQKDKGVCADLNRVIMEKGTYPAIWKKS